MLLKLSVGLSKKVGERNYGSRGACVSFEVELDAGAIQQPERVQAQIRRLYQLARTAIAEELRGPAPGSRDAGEDNGSERNGSDCHENHNPSGDDHGLSNPIVRPATEGQVKAIYGLAKRTQADLAALVRSRFRVERVEDLSLPAASALIDELKHTGGQA